MNKDTPSYDDLLHKIEQQESEINRLLKKETSINNFDFYK